MVNHIAAQTLVLETVLALVPTVVAYFGSPYLLRLIGVGPDIFALANRFQQVLFLGLVFSFGSLMFQALMRGVGEVKIPFYINLTTLVLNFGFDPLFINGCGPVPAFGVAGATVSTQLLSFGVGPAVLLRGRSGIQLSFSGFRFWAPETSAQARRDLVHRRVGAGAGPVGDDGAGHGLRHDHAGDLRHRLAHSGPRQHPGAGHLAGPLHAGGLERGGRQRGAGPAPGPRRHPAELWPAVGGRGGNLGGGPHRALLSG